MSEYPSLVRTRRGGMVHRADCRFARTGVPWLWADGKGWGDVQAAGQYGVGFCIHCRPLSDRPYLSGPGVVGNQP